MKSFKLNKATLKSSQFIDNYEFLHQDKCPHAHMEFLNSIKSSN